MVLLIDMARGDQDLLVFYRLLLFVVVIFLSFVSFNCMLCCVVLNGFYDVYCMRFISCYCRCCCC